jgi:RNA polymerase sigma-70 factor
MATGCDKDEQLKLAQVFLQEVPPHITLPERARLGELLHAVVRTGRASWPQVHLPAEVFIRDLAQRLRLRASWEGTPLESLLKGLWLGDLYLACACVQRVPEALRALEGRYLAKLPTLLTACEWEDVRQNVFILLTLGTGGGPQLLTFTGEGPLLSWMRTVARNMAHRQGGACRALPEGNIAGVLEAQPDLEPDAETALFKRRFRTQFGQAIRESFAALPLEQQALLQDHFIQGLSTVQLAEKLAVNQSTISRRLKSARTALYTDAKRRLKERLRLSSQEFLSHLRVLDGPLDLSLR